jgi:pyruvate carboxylase
MEHYRQCGDTSVLPTRQYLYSLRSGEEVSVPLERGVKLHIGLEAISEPDERGLRTVVCLLNGQLRPLTVRDRGIAPAHPTAEKADRTDPTHVAAKFSGTVTLTAKPGDTVAAGDPIGTIEAMKMEAALTAPCAGAIARIAVDTVVAVEVGDLVMVIGNR